MWANLLIEAQQRGDPTLVTKTSISNHGGLGLFAAREFKKGNFLPYGYPGRVTEAVVFSHINDLLHAMTLLGTKDEDEADALELLDQLGIRQSGWSEKIEDSAVVGYLDEKYGIKIKRIDNYSGPVNWDKIYDSFIEYVFTTKSGEWYYIWKYYDAETGNIYVNPKKPYYAGLFINEPPPYHYFRNRITGRPQKSEPNVQVVEGIPGHDPRRQFFQLTKNVRPGEELLWCYGPLYLRSQAIGHGKFTEPYKINLSREACGNPALLQTYKDPQFENPDDKERIEKYLMAVKNYRPLGDEFIANDLPPAMTQPYALKLSKGREKGRAKKGPGRPRKYPVEPERLKLKERKRERPISETVYDLYEQRGEKRGPGRPRKHPLPLPFLMERHEFQKEPKRGPGRPRKRPLTFDDREITPDDEELEKPEMMDIDIEFSYSDDEDSKFQKGQKVDILMTHVRGYEDDFKHAWLTGVIVSEKIGGGRYKVRLDYNGDIVMADENYLRPAHILDDKFVKAVIGLPVEVREIRDGVESWWEAFLVDTVGHDEDEDEVVIKWRGHYEEHPDTQVVSTLNVRPKLFV